MRAGWSAVPGAVFALALVGCGGGEPSAPAPQQQPAEPTSAPQAAATDRPARGTCLLVQAGAGDQYTVADAGTAVVGREGDRLVLGQVSPAAGWTHEVTDQEADEVEVEFRRGGEEVDLEVEIDDGRVEAEVCVDDD
jgi:hypothetical protein